MKTPSIAIEGNGKSTVIDILNARLADAIDLALITKQAHWNLKGPSFIAVHEMLDPMRAAIDTHVDIIAERAFELRFQLADYVEVQGASLENGLLHLELKRELPESKKPRSIQINGTTPTIEDNSVN